MNLAFSTKFTDGSPTYFIEKINSGIIEMDKGYKNEVWEKERLYSERFGFNLIELDVTDYAKIHTIRRDSKDRWKEGNKIHFIINNRTKDRFQFAPLLTVEKIQKFELKYLSIAREPIDLKPMIWIDGYLFYDPATGIDKGIEQFAKNDGFDSVEKFFEWFSEDFTVRLFIGLKSHTKTTNQKRKNIIMVNRVILIGNLGKDPEVKRLKNGQAVGKFSIATNENYKDKAGEWQTETEWHDVVVWRSLAERAESTLKKECQFI